MSVKSTKVPDVLKVFNSSYFSNFLPPSPLHCYIKPLGKVISLFTFLMVNRLLEVK